MSPEAAQGEAEPSIPQPRRPLIAGLVAYAWVRIALIVSSRPFETPDTQSYRAGQATRPPLSSALLSWLGDTGYVLASAVVSTVGFAALMAALWDPARRSTKWMVAGVAVVSMLPMVLTYEHWLVPDSLFLGLSLLLMAGVWRTTGRRWEWMALGALALSVATAKELGVAVVLLAAGVLAVRRFRRHAFAFALAGLLVFAIVVLPGSSRQGIVLWHQPDDTELTMQRFRVMVSGLLWTDLGPQFAEIRARAGACGMTMDQLVMETFLLTDHIVAFRGCDELWEVVDGMSQVDVLAAHIRNPTYVADGLERGMAPDMEAMMLWSYFRPTAPFILGLDRAVASAVALLPLAALGVAVARRQGRLLGLLAVSSTGIALVAVFVDPTAQDRHSIVFRVVAATLALFSMSEVFAPRVRETRDGDEAVDVDNSAEPEQRTAVLEPAGA